MKFVSLDNRMRLYETAHDLCVLPSVFIVARVDGRGFTRLTRDIVAFEAPFDQRFRDCMVTTTAHLMDCGFQAIFGYTQSDEISILIDRDDATFGRKLRKLTSILAGEASAVFTAALGQPAAFDCRISVLPTEQAVVDYFRWRQEDAARNALNGHCYWQLRRGGESSSAATERLRGLGSAAKNELLFQAGINFNETPNWQKRGTGAHWQTFEQEGRSKASEEATSAKRRRLKIEYELPMKAAFERFVADLVVEAAAKRPH